GLANAAITISNARFDVVSATQNMFTLGAANSQLVFVWTGGGNVVFDPKLTNARSFVQALYNEVLGRTATSSEIDPWASLLLSQGQAAVVNGILHSGEALGRIVDAFYLRFLGRQSDANGRAGWIGFLQQGGTEEQLETLFLSSPEYLSHINVDFVQSLYMNVLGRVGSAGELSLWNNNIQNVGGIQGIASAFVRSPENRLHTVVSYYQSFL